MSEPPLNDTEEEQEEIRQERKEKNTTKWQRLCLSLHRCWQVAASKEPWCVCVCVQSVQQE